MDATAENSQPSAPPHVDQLVLGTADGRRLAGDVATPAGAGAVAVLCHPHPDYGGDRFNAVVEALFHTLPAVGVAALRFDFRRPVGGAGLGGAALDVTAALDDAHERFAELPTYLVGYSFGASAALAAAPTRHDLAGLVLVAPPMSMMPRAEPPVVPALVLVPAHDQFSPPDTVAPIVATWPDVESETIEMADHFLVGRTSWVARRVAGWITTRN
jgi:alpha/beta superfamily hydrolase